MSKKYRVVIFGKKGCDKCKVLKDRLGTLLSSEEWSDFDSVSYDVDTEDGLVSFVQTECLNPQRIPSFVIEKFDDERQRYERLINPASRGTEQKFRPWRYVGMETDYSGEGRGIITPKMITGVFAQARSV